MPRDYRACLDDMLEAAGRVREYTHGLSREEFTRDRKGLDAVVRNLEVIGEAAKGVPEDVRSRHPAVEWQKIAGLRDILIHQYFGIDVDIVWDVVQNKLPAVEDEVKRILAEQAGE